METLFEQIDKLGDSTAFTIIMIGIGIALTYLAIREARKEPK